MSTLAAIRSSLLLNSMVSPTLTSNSLIHAENLTSEQYTGVVPRQINALSVSRDTLNPLLNANVLKQRLGAIDYYSNLHGPRYMYWPHYFMRSTAQMMWRYKFNFAVKGFCAFMLYREVNQYRNLNEKTVMTIQQNFASFGSIGAHAGLLVGVCCLI